MQWESQLSAETYEINYKKLSVVSTGLLEEANVACILQVRSYICDHGPRQRHSSLREGWKRGLTNNGSISGVSSTTSGQSNTSSSNASMVSTGSSVTSAGSNLTNNSISRAHSEGNLPTAAERIRDSKVWRAAPSTKHIRIYQSVTYSVNTFFQFHM